MESTQEREHRVYFKNLDGIRFICFFSVFLYHSFATEKAYILEHPFYITVKRLFNNGSLGVNFFFVLSGFLITYLLIVEKNLKGQINLGAFYVRRMLRIWPLYFFCVFFGFFAFPVLKEMFGQVPDETAQLPMYLSFLANFDYIQNTPDAGILSLLWSIAVEEQFYLIWPALLFFVPVKKYPYVFLIVLIACLVYRFIYLDDLNRLDIHTLSVMGDFVVGGFAAYFAVESKKFIQFFNKLPRFYIFLGYLILIVLFLFRKEVFRYEPALTLIERLVFALLFAFVILEQSFANRSLFKFSNSKFLTTWGNYSYGLYCLHFTAILIVHTLIRRWGLENNAYEFIFLEGGLTLLLAMGMAWVSYRYYETPFLRLKKRFTIIKNKQP